MSKKKRLEPKWKPAKPACCQAEEILEYYRIKKLPFDKDGNCHQQSYNILADLKDFGVDKLVGWTLVNGEVDCLHPSIGPTRMNHTWLEYDGFVVDWAYQTKTYTPIEKFYKRFNVQIRRRFTPREVVEHIGESGYFDKD